MKELKKGNILVKTKEEKKSFSSLWNSSSDWKERCATVSLNEDGKSKVSELKAYKLKNGIETNVITIPIEVDTVIQSSSSAGKTIFFLENMPDIQFGLKDKADG